MRNFQRNRPVIGVLAGWQAYTGTIHSFLDFVFGGIKAAARDLSCNLLIGCGVGPSYQGTRYTALPLHADGIDFVPVGPWNTDGLILCSPILFDRGMQYFQELTESGFPVVFAGDRDTGPSVSVDNESGIQQAVEHLVAHGHRRIAFIAGHQQPEGDCAARMRGYISGLQRHDLAFDPDLVVHGFHETSRAYQAMKTLLGRGKTFSAVIASNDESAVGAMEALHDAGLIVPQDVALIGFDDRQEARAVIPLLTTVHHPMFELGYRSLEMLTQILAGTAPPNQMVRIPTHLIVRESCGCLPGAVTDVERMKTALPAARTTFSGWSKPNESRNPPIAQAMAETVYREMQRLSRRDVEYLCCRLFDAFKISLTHDNSDTFLQAIQQVLEHAANIGEDLYAWQGAVTVLKNRAMELLETLPNTLPEDKVEQMLHQARVAISEVSRGQYSRHLMHQATIASQIGQMTSRFFAAETEEEVFDILSQNLPEMGIPDTAVAIYEPDGDDPFGQSVLNTPRRCPQNTQRFNTYQFPPPGLYPADRPFQLAILPLVMHDEPFGFAAFNANDLENLGSITRQLVAALRSAKLHQQAITARQMAEEERRSAEQAQQLAEEARQLAEEANQSKSRFLSVVSHELRTPLNLIFGLSNMMIEEGSPVNDQEILVSRKDLERIYIGAQHLESLIRDVIDLARSDIGQLTLVREPLDLREVLEAVAVIGEQLAYDKDLTWQVDIAPSLPRVHGDRTRLRQVILNLVNNAVKFTSYGSVTLSAHVVGQNMMVSVNDTGLGIPLDEQSAIFDEFRQSRRTTARGFGGLGLGLSICKRLVEMHGGKIGVESSGREGEGSRFYFSLPVIESVEPPLEALSPSPCAERILLLVKEIDGSEQLKSYLAGQGFQVDMHTTGQKDDWMTWLQPALPDKIALDLGITSQRGWEILKKIKENPTTRDIPVLFYTLENQHDSGAFLDLNILTKPLNTAELAEELVAQGLVEDENNAAHRSILVVDDDPVILDLHTRILNSMASGYRILQAQNGREALQIIGSEQPALVLLDLMMPEVDGFTVLETMQAEESTRQIPVIVLTGQVLTEEDMARLNCGVASVLSKGMYSIQETLERVTSALSRKRRPGTESQRLVLKAMTYIHSHYKDPISRGDVASYVGVSERHLARCFQQEIGLAPITYLNRFRIKVAKMLLGAGRMNVTEVAMEVGFSAGAYFTRVFRDEEGMSPREFLQRKGLE